MLPWIFKSLAIPSQTNDYWANDYLFNKIGHVHRFDAETGAYAPILKSEDCYGCSSIWIQALLQLVMTLQFLERPW
jgi:hypothetical protein